MAKRTGGFIGQDGINAPDPATGVTGTAGNEQVTVSWTAPSDVGGAAITGYSVVADDGTRAYPPFSYAAKTVSVASQDTTPEGVFFKSDGTKMYVAGSGTDAVYQYSLSTSWDVSSASYDSVSLSVSGQDTIPSDLYFKTDGTSLYVMGRSNDTVFQYTLSTAWDLSTASYASKSFSVTSQASSPTGIYLKSDGTKMYVIGYTADAVFQYSLSTAWDVSSASYDSVSLDVSAAGTNPQGLGFSLDGTKLLVAEVSTGDFVSEYGLSTAWDLSTAAYTGELLSYAAEDGYGSGVYYKGEETVFVLGRDSDAVFQYEAVGYPTESPVTITGLTNGTSYTFNVWAINPFGWSSPSDASGGVSPYAPRALFGGGAIGGTTNVIDTVVITTLGNASDFGDLPSAGSGLFACSSVTRGIFAGGSGPSSADISYVTIGSTGSASDFGDLISANYNGAALSNSTRGIFAAGALVRTSIYYITIASTGNAVDFGSVPTTTTENTASCASSTRGVWAGGVSNQGTAQQISYVTIASTGNSTNFGNLASDRKNAGGASSATRALFGGNYGSNYRSIDYVTIASTGNGADFGDLVGVAYGNRGTSSSTRGLFMGGLNPDAGFALVNNIDYVTISTTGNAADFGDMTISASDRSALSNDHGGLQ